MRVTTQPFIISGKPFVDCITMCMHLHYLKLGDVEMLGDCGPLNSLVLLFM